MKSIKNLTQADLTSILTLTRCMLLAQFALRGFNVLISKIKVAIIITIKKDNVCKMLKTMPGAHSKETINDTPE